MSLAIPTTAARCIKLGAAAALFAAAALTTLPPAAGDQFHYGHIDSLMVLYMLEWTRYAVFAEPQRLFEGLAHYGMGDSFFYHHLLLGGLPIYAPVAAIFGPGVGLNVLTIASPFLNATAAATAAWFLVGRWWPAVVAGFIFAFAPIQKEFLQFHSLLMFWWTPLAMALWFWFLRRPAWWKLSGAWLCVFIQFATTVYLGFIALLILLVLIGAAMLSRRRPRLDRRLVARAAAATLAAALPFVPLLMGYVGFWLDNQEVRTLEEARRLSARLPAYLPWVTQSLWWFQVIGSRVSGFTPSFFLGILPTALTALGLVAGAAQARMRATAAALGISGVLLFVLSLGPELWWQDELTGVALPFAAAHALIPGFASLGSPTFVVGGIMLAMALLAAIAIAQLYRWRRTGGARAHVLAALLLVLLAAEFARAPVHLASIPYDTRLQAALAESPDGPVTFIPSGAEFTSQVPYTERVWWSLNGGRQPVVGGYTGSYAPRGTAYLARLIDGADVNTRPQVLDALLAFGVRTLVLDRKFLTDQQIEAWQTVAREVRPSTTPLDAGRFVVLHLGSQGVPAMTGWSEVETQLVLRSGLADLPTVIPVTIHNRASLAWRPPPGRRTRTAELVWEASDGATATRQPVRLRPPPIIPAGATAQFLEPLTTRSPTVPGRYRIWLSVDGERLASADIEIRAQPTTSDRPPNKADLHVLSPQVCMNPGDGAYLLVQAVNTGSQDWQGFHRLGTRWSVPDDRFVPQDLTTLEDRLSVPFDAPTTTWTSVAPGSGFVFEGVIRAPSAPGLYTLTLGMVEEDVAWFNEIEVPAIVVAASDQAACAHPSATGPSGRRA